MLAKLGHGDQPQGAGCSAESGSGMSSAGMASSNGACAGSTGGASGAGAVGTGDAGRGAGVGTPRWGAAAGAGPKELSAQSTMPPKISSGMIRAHQALLAGGDFDGTRFRRQSSHSPFRSSGSSCVSQIPIESTICASVYHGWAGRFIGFRPSLLDHDALGRTHAALVVVLATFQRK